MLEWHLLAAFIATLAIAWWPLIGISLLMWSATIIAAARSALGAHLEQGAPRWCRPLLFLLHLAQPVVRSWHRLRYRFAGRIERKNLPLEPLTNLKKLSAREFDLYWQSNDGSGREHLLSALI